MSIIEIDKKRGRVQKGKTLFEMATTMDIALPSSCQQQGKCKECIVEIKGGHSSLSGRTPEEEHLSANFRLACQCRVIGEKDILCQTLERGQIFIEEDSSLSKKVSYELEPSVQKSGASVLLDGNAIDRYRGVLLGLAIDIGTTTVVLKLVDLERGTTLSTSSFENPQRYAGSNVMSRILYDTKHGKKELKRVLTAHLTKAIQTMTKHPQQIYEVVIGGNTTMRDLFFGLDVTSIGQTPYISKSEAELRAKETASTSLSMTGKKSQLPIHPKARVYGLPLIGSHVGADTVATLMAIDFEMEDNLIVIMDIGTNTEIVIGNRHRAVAASSPSGPAFEGGGITFGMPALPGAITDINIGKQGAVSFQTVNQAEAIGICGSGLIKVLSELLDKELINEVGRLDEESKYYITDELYISEHDINLLAQTKGANASALNILLKQLDINYGAIKKFYIAGGFGKHIDIEAGIRIGLFPDIPRERFVQIGNAAIEGLVRALLSKPKRDLYERFVQNIGLINLETDPDFFDYFVNGCLFTPLENTQV